MGIVIRQSIKASVGFYLGVAIGVINQMYVSTHFLTVEQLALSRLLFENALLFSAFAHLGAPFIADRYFGRFRDDTEGHHGILLFLLALPLIGGVVFTGLYLLFTPAIKAYFAEESPMVLKYHTLVIPMTFFWMYMIVLDAYCRNNARIAIPSFIREVYLRLANVVLILLLGFGWLHFDAMLYLLVAAHGVAVVLLMLYLSRLGKLYLRLPDRALFTPAFVKTMLGYGGFTLLGGLGVSLMLFIDRSMLAGEKGLISTGIFIIASYIAGIIEIPKKAISQISIPLLSDALHKNNIPQLRSLTQKSALHQLLAGGAVFLVIWCGIDDIFHLIPKGDTYGAGKYVVLFLALVKLFDIGTGLNTEIILYSPYYRWATAFIVGAAVLAFTLNLWLIPRYGFTGAAFATVITTFCFSICKMTFVWHRYRIHPFSRGIVVIVLLLVLLYFLAQLLPAPSGNPLERLLALTARSAGLLILFGALILKLKISPEINHLAGELKKKWLK